MFNLEDFEIIELHGFSGVSFKAHAGVIYIRFKLKDVLIVPILLQVKLKLTIQKG